MAFCRSGAAARTLGPLLTLLLLAAQAHSRPATPAAASRQLSSGGSSSSGRPSAGRRRLAEPAPKRLLQPAVLAAHLPADPLPENPSRQLRQADGAVDRCRDGPEPEEEQEQCVACDGLQRSKTAACRVWIDRIALHFPRGSTEPPTPQQRDAALAALRGSSRPSTGCCKAMATALEGRCGCNPLFQHVRNETAMDEPMLSVEYVQGSNAILALACSLTDGAQLACT